MFDFSQRFDPKWLYGGSARLKWAFLLKLIKNEQKINIFSNILFFCYIKFRCYEKQKKWNFMHVFLILLGILPHLILIEKIARKGVILSDFLWFIIAVDKFFIHFLIFWFWDPKYVKKNTKIWHFWSKNTNFAKKFKFSPKITYLYKIFVKHFILGGIT